MVDVMRDAVWFDSGPSIRSPLSKRDQAIWRKQSCLYNEFQ